MFVRDAGGCAGPPLMRERERERLRRAAANDSVSCHTLGAANDALHSSYYYINVAGP